MGLETNELFAFPPQNSHSALDVPPDAPSFVDNRRSSRRRINKAAFDTGGSPTTLNELAAKIEGVKHETVTGPFPAFYEPMKAIYDELMAKHGGDLDRVRAGMPKKNYVVCELSYRAKEAWKKVAKDVNAESLFFSPDTLAKQLNHHPELTPTEYAGIFRGIKDYTGKIYDRGRGSIGFAIEVDGRYYRAILKPTLNNLEVYLGPVDTK